LLPLRSCSWWREATVLQPCTDVVGDNG
jgi:hypothetical protein